MKNVTTKKLVIVSGLAGAGKTVVIRALEDAGYFCVDNLPSSLVQNFVGLLRHNRIQAPHLALALDSRDLNSPAELEKQMTQLRNYCDCTLIFLESRTEVLLKRFRETRRLHPLSHHHNFQGDRDHSWDHVSDHLNLADAIKLDEAVLTNIRALADQVINTSETSSQYLRQMILRHYSTEKLSNSVFVTLASFGFKYGAPQDLDTIFDVRCFANPHYQEELRPLTGLNQSVKDYVFSDENVLKFIEKSEDFLRFMYPLYISEGKRYFIVGIGCTGGKHRSVAIVEELAKRLKPEIPYLSVEHRHFDLE